MSERFAVNQALQLWQNIALDTYVKYSDFKSNAASSTITDLKNEEKSSDSDDNFAEEEALTHTDNGTHAPHGSNDEGQR